MSMTADDMINLFDSVDAVRELVSKTKFSKELQKKYNINNNNYNIFFNIIYNFVEVVGDEDKNAIRELLENTELLDNETIELILSFSDEILSLKLLFITLFKYIKKVLKENNMLFEINIQNNILKEVSMEFVGTYISDIIKDTSDARLYLNVFELIALYLIQPAAFLSKVKFGEGIESIKGFAFSGAFLCEEYEFPDTLKEMVSEEDLILTAPYNDPAELSFIFSRLKTGQFAFNFLLSNLSFAENWKIIAARAFSFCFSLETITLAAEKIGDYAFDHCESLTDINLLNVQNIGCYCFNYCIQATNFNLPAVKQIGDDAFNHCMFVTEFNLPAIEQLGSYVFDGCESLKTVILGKNVQKIATLGNNVNLDVFVCHSITPPQMLDSNAIIKTQSLKIYVPADSVDTYKTATNWSDYTDYIEEMPDEYKWEGE